MLGNKIRVTIKYLGFFVLSFMVLLPFFWTLYAALVKNDLDLFSPITAFAKYGFDNFSYVLNKGDILVWMKNSAFVVSIITVANLLINTMAGYALARFRFIGRKSYFAYVTGIMMIPSQVLVIPIFLVISKMGFINTYAALILPFVYNPFGVFLMRQFFLDFPKEIEDAAKIDGLGSYATFFRIALPLAKNSLM